MVLNIDLRSRSFQVAKNELKRFKSDSEFSPSDESAFDWPLLFPERPRHRWLRPAWPRRPSWPASTTVDFRKFSPISCKKIEIGGAKFQNYSFFEFWSNWLKFYFRCSFLVSYEFVSFWKFNIRYFFRYPAICTFWEKNIWIDSF